MRAAAELCLLQPRGDALTGPWGADPKEAPPCASKGERALQEAVRKLLITLIEDCGAFRSELDMQL